ncbi:MAG TPA: hypothetical protein VN476_04240 [Pyrinomonadaceae bacterium]|nr:hypothetical protein [Pyrinomonadaceae bacterium]
MPHASRPNSLTKREAQLISLLADGGLVDHDPKGPNNPEHFYRCPKACCRDSRAFDGDPQGLNRNPQGFYSDAASRNSVNLGRNSAISIVFTGSRLLNPESRNSADA